MSFFQQTDLTYADRVKGSLIGGAVGDALGYAVEFSPLSAIREKYGPEGITQYELDPESGKALISDDTQMTLFTANGLLCSYQRCVNTPLSLLWCRGKVWEEKYKR
ncbi:MAG: ADP-ribosylglycohydrolase family protein [Oscillospiraceae bacterium]|nr:ADP-ribosylglycohydrolase family protein [Oscillospiraceae bacterium]